MGRIQLSFISSLPRAPKGHSAEVRGICSLPVRCPGASLPARDSGSLPGSLCARAAPASFRQELPLPAALLPLLPRALGWKLCLSPKVGARGKGEAGATRGLGGRGGVSSTWWEREGVWVTDGETRPGSGCAYGGSLVRRRRAVEARRVPQGFWRTGWSSPR